MSSVIFVACASALVIAAIGIALFVIGSPEQIRASRMDQRRVQDLTSLSATISNRHQTGDPLPATLQDVIKEARWSSLAIEDPETRAPYGYNVKGPDEFEVCAVFATSTEDPQLGSPSWRHPTGLHCFDFTVKSRPH